MRDVLRPCVSKWSSLANGQWHATLNGTRRTCGRRRNNGRTAYPVAARWPARRQQAQPAHCRPSGRCWQSTRDVSRMACPSIANSMERPRPADPANPLPSRRSPVPRHVALDAGASEAATTTNRARWLYARSLDTACRARLAWLAAMLPLAAQAAGRSPPPDVGWPPIWPLESPSVESRTANCLPQ